METLDSVKINWNDIYLTNIKILPMEVSGEQSKKLLDIHLNWMVNAF